MSQNVPPDYSEKNPASQGQYPPQTYGDPYPAQPYNSTTYTPAGVSGQTVVMMPQQAGPVTNYRDYLGFSIFNLLCCCLPLGIYALIKSLDTRRYNDMGNAALAQKSSRSARTVNRIALGIGIVLNLIVIGVCVWYVVVVVNAVRSSTDLSDLDNYYGRK